VDLGFTSGRRTPVKLDRRFVDAEVRIATGLVEPHFMAGYSGGPQSHRSRNRACGHDPDIPQRALHGGSRRRSSAISPAIPLHEEQLEIVRMLGDVHAVNTSSTRTAISSTSISAK
jgi:hypothetical protein